MDNNTTNTPLDERRPAIAKTVGLKEALPLFTTFFKIGAFTLGGGYA